MPRLIITEGEIMLQEAMKTLEDAEAKAIREAVSRKRIQKKVCEAPKKHFLSL